MFALSALPGVMLGCVIGLLPLLVPRRWRSSNGGGVFISRRTTLIVFGLVAILPMLLVLFVIGYFRAWKAGLMLIGGFVWLGAVTLSNVEPRALKRVLAFVPLLFFSSFAMGNATGMLLTVAAVHMS